MKDVSFQLYSARNFPPFANVLEALGEAGYSQVEERERVRASGFDEHLVKPVGLDEIQRVLEVR